MDEPRGWIYDRSSFRAWCPACDYKPEVLCPLHAAAPRMLGALKAIRDSYLDETTNYEQLVALMRAVATETLQGSLW